MPATVTCIRWFFTIAPLRDRKRLRSISPTAFCTSAWIAAAPSPANTAWARRSSKRSATCSLSRISRQCNWCAAPSIHRTSRTQIRSFRGRGCAPMSPAPTSRIRWKRPALRRFSNEHDDYIDARRMPDSSGLDRREGAHATLRRDGRHCCGGRTADCGDTSLCRCEQHCRDGCRWRDQAWLGESGRGGDTAGSEAHEYPARTSLAGHDLHPLGGVELGRNGEGNKTEEQT